MIQYVKLDKYYGYLEHLIKQKLTFEIFETTYSKKIKLNDGRSFMFNEIGENDFRSLSLINKVRTDASNYKGNIDLGHIDFYKLYDIPKENEKIFKIDIRSAYWKYALHKSIITEKTNDYFVNMFKNERAEFGKKARLKALGSLATKKYYKLFICGKEVQEASSSIVRETKPLYMSICKGIDDLMKKSKQEIDGLVYYYWDCVFVKDNFEKTAINFFKDHKYEVKVEETYLKHMKIGDNNYLLSMNDEKMYMVKKDEFIINNNQNGFESFDNRKISQNRKKTIIAFQ
jgi:hypothetical protein